MKKIDSINWPLNSGVILPPTDSLVYCILPEPVESTLFVAEGSEIHSWSTHYIYWLGFKWIFFCDYELPVYLLWSVSPEIQSFVITWLEHW